MIDHKWKRIKKEKYLERGIWHSALKSMKATIFALFLSQILNKLNEIKEKRRSSIEKRKRKCKNKKVKGKNVNKNMKKILIRMKSRIEKKK